jgi:multiple sugar transport system permease protein
MAVTKEAQVRRPAKQKNQVQRNRSETLAFYAFISPWLIGFIFLTAGPMIATLGFSFTFYDLASPPVWAGLDNYVYAFKDPDFWQSLKVTGIFVLFYLPLSIIFGLLIALMMNQKLKGIAFFRTIYYMPVVVPSVASAVLWLWIFHPSRGLLNNALGLIGVPKADWPYWFLDPNFALPAIIIMSLWSVGSGMIIYLAGLKAIPQNLYEAASIDGANPMHRFWYITIPQLSPILFFQIIQGLIGAFQVFAPAKILSPSGLGGPEGSTLFYVLNLYNVGFGGSHQMGYASALSWILFMIIMACTLLVFRSSSVWVYYEAERP